MKNGPSGTILGVTTPLWSTVGLLRRIGELHNRSTPAQLAARRHHPVVPHQVAVLIAAHNEELLIAEIIPSAKMLVPASNIHVVSDGSADAISVIADTEGLNYPELDPNPGQAGALAAGIEHCNLASIYKSCSSSTRIHG